MPRPPYCARAVLSALAAPGGPGRPGHFVANGGFKIGFGIAPGLARLMVDLVLESRDTLPDAFRIG